MRLRIQVHRARIVERRLTGMASRAMNMSPAFDEVADLMMQVYGKVFDSQGRRGGGSWRKLTTDWLARKREAGLDPRILHETGALRASMTQRGDENQILEITDKGLRFGSQLPYAERHHTGGGNVPARPFIDRFSENDKRMMKRILASHIASGRAQRRVTRLIP